MRQIARLVSIVGGTKRDTISKCPKAELYIPNTEGRTQSAVIERGNDGAKARCPEASRDPRLPGMVPSRDERPQDRLTKDSAWREASPLRL